VWCAIASVGIFALVLGLLKMVGGSDIGWGVAMLIAIGAALAWPLPFSLLVVAIVAAVPIIIVAMPFAVIGAMVKGRKRQSEQESANG
jgi:hypothetical protein